MIQVIVRIVPGGDEKRAFEQAVAEVTRVDGDRFANYAVSVGESQNAVNGALDWSARGHVLGVDRRASVWSLVARVAKFAIEEAEKAQR